MTSKAERLRKKRQARRQAPSAPRVIGANDNIATANDNDAGIEIRGVVLNSEQARRFRAAAELQESSDRMHQGAGRNAMAALEAEIDAVITGRKVKADIAETVALEQLRGAEFETSTKQESEGRKRNLSRDGLETLLTAKSITHVQHAAGLRYRADYEMLDPEKGLTPPAIDQSRNITRGGEGWAQKKLERELFVRDLEAMIQEEDPSFRGALGRSDVERVGRAVWALREIAGKGSNLRNLSNSGSVIARTSEALIVALECAAIAYGLE